MRVTEMDLYGGTLMRLCRKWNLEASGLFSATETLESRLRREKADHCDRSLA